MQSESFISTKTADALLELIGHPVQHAKIYAKGFDRIIDRLAYKDLSVTQLKGDLYQIISDTLAQATP